MHEEVIEVAFLGSDILLSRKPSQTLLVDEYSQRFNTVDQCVYSQVKLQIIDQVRLMQVSLSYDRVRTLKINVLKASNQVNSSALAHVDRLDNEGLIVFLAELVF